MDIINEVEKLWDKASNAFGEKRYDEGAKLYKDVIDLLTIILSKSPKEPGEVAIKQNLANAYLDMAHCMLIECDEKINPGAHALLSAIKYGCIEKQVFENLLYCMNITNKFMSAKIRNIANNPQNVELLKWQNQGYDLLKTPTPPGTPGRDWEGAARCYGEAIRIKPESAPSFHGLGLALKGLKMDEEAIKAWIQVKVLEPEYNFEFRIKFQLE